MKAPDATTSVKRPLARLRDIHKSFGRNVVLRGVSLEVRPGECHVLAGENGAGKSTLINILSGVVTDFEGTIEVGGEVVAPASPLAAAKLGVAVIHQELSLVPAMSVADNLLLAHPPQGGPLARFGFVSDRRQRERAAELVRAVGLDVDEVDLDAPVGRLSMTQQQLLEIAKALSHDARVVVMDEPTSALPATEVQTVFRLIDRLKADGRGVVYISHKMEEIERVADHITVLRDGEVVGSAPAAEMPEDRLVQLMVGREISGHFPYEPAQAGGEEMLRVEDLTLRPIGRQVNPPVDGVSLVVRGGEVLGIGGLQGSGASELLLAIFGAAGGRTSGTILVNGEPVHIRSVRDAMAAGIALLTNDRKGTGLVLSMSVRANTTLADLPRLTPGGFVSLGRERDAAARHAKALNLRAASLEIDVGSLSGGNQQKVALAKWLQRDPRVLLLDEPTRGVDIGAKREIYGLINQLKQRGVAIVVISTELPELIGLSDRVAVMHRGKIAATLDRAAATPEAILSAAMGGTHPGATAQEPLTTNRSSTGPRTGHDDAIG